MSERPEKILMLIKGLGLGGAERHVADLAKTFVAEGRLVHVAYMLPNKDALVDELVGTGVQVSCLQYQGAIGRMTSFFRFVRLCKRLKPDIVHSHLPVAGFFARMAKVLCKVKVIYTEHNVIDRLSPVMRFAHRATHYLDDAAISCSRAVADSLRWPSIVIDNGIRIPNSDFRSAVRDEYRHSLGVEGDDCVILCVANLLPKKNHALLVNAFKALLGRGDKALLFLAGQDATERHHLETLVAESGSACKVRFLGARKDILELLAAADIYCMSSDYEGLPLALLEAMAMQLPCVVTDAGGMGEVVRDAECGVVVPVGDLDGLVSGLVSLVNNPSERKVLGRKAREAIVRRFSIESCADRVITVYREVLVHG